MPLRLITGVVWLIIGLPLLAINITGVPMFGIEPGPWTLMLGLMATLVGVFRLWTAWLLRRKHTPPPPRRRLPERDLEYHPEFDFTRPEPRDEPK